MALRSCWLALLVLMLTACSSAPVQRKRTLPPPPPMPVVKPTPASADTPGGLLPGDGPPAETVAVDTLPEPVPIEEPELPRPNQPYSVQGEVITPETGKRAYSARGTASWYGKRFHGRKTASGERYDMYAFSAAHRTLPIPSYARVTNLANGKSVIVRVNDRGPFHKRRLIDLSWAAASKLDFIRQGEAQVLIERVLPGESTSGASTPPAPDSRRADTPMEAGSPAAGTPVAGKVYVQAASFRHERAAQALISRLRQQLGENTGLSAVQAGNFWRVLAGPWDDEQQARAAMPAIEAVTGQGTLLYRPPQLASDDSAP